MTDTTTEAQSTGQTLSHPPTTTSFPTPKPAAEAKPVFKPAPVPEPTKEERGARLVESYARNMEHNSPRTDSELKELRFLLGHELKHEPLTDDEKAAMLKGVVQVRKGSFDTAPLAVVPVTLNLAPVPADVAAVHPELAGHSYFVVDDGIVFVDANRHVVDFKAA